jgi:hypothetical protein
VATARSGRGRQEELAPRRRRQVVTHRRYPSPSLPADACPSSPTHVLNFFSDGPGSAPRRRRRRCRAPCRCASRTSRTRPATDTSTSGTLHPRSLSVSVTGHRAVCFLRPHLLCLPAPLIRTCRCRSRLAGEIVKAWGFVRGGAGAWLEGTVARYASPAGAFASPASPCRCRTARGRRLGAAERQRSRTTVRAETEKGEFLQIFGSRFLIAIRFRRVSEKYLGGICRYTPNLDRDC